MAENSFIRSSLLNRHGVIGLFSLRTGGISLPPFDSQNFGYALGDSDHNVDDNLDRLVEKAGLSRCPHQAVQVHQSETLYCSGDGIFHKQQSDILITDQLNTPLAIRTADCLPLLLADRQAGITVAAHAGWRGTVAGVAKEAVSQMVDRGAKVERIIASLGPCIGPCCFTIGEETAIALASCCQGATQFVTGSEQQHADLWQINQLQLLQSGLKKEHIEIINECTCCHPDRYFSYRRDSLSSGRHLGVVELSCKP
ncbi:laccase domain-containing protein [Mariprofundus micogutta]|uniref:Purine nucleoside phosphorylase n=1 Tax=Mariprofundus micogutta TaxID=1921010 RepID=A0A1L8CKC7_9PROT|nr:peptidoglycan editing factor PgeF [Mariprofundus micogutta]GAV19367.1 laccase domain-containing protein [Mariprofundus micogutta]